jgi:hypothetical protein
LIPLAALLRRRRVYVTLELIGLAILLGALTYALRDVWDEALPLLRHADLGDFAIATAIVAAYYLVFVLGWMRILAAYGIRVPYAVALQAEMLSMLAKYIPGGVWTPTARVVALRRFGVRDTPVVLASILLEAGLSALAGIGVFLVGLVIIGGADVPLLPLGAFGVLVGFLLYPPVFAWVARRLLRPFGASDVSPLPARTAFSLSASTRSRGRSAGPRCSSCCGRWEVTLRSPRSRTSAASARSVRSSRCSRSSPPRGSGCAKRRCTGCCSRSSARRSRSAPPCSTGSRSRSSRRCSSSSAFCCCGGETRAGRSAWGPRLVL